MRAEKDRGEPYFLSSNPLPTSQPITIIKCGVNSTLTIEKITKQPEGTGGIGHDLARHEAVIASTMTTILSATSGATYLGVVRVDVNAPSRRQGLPRIRKVVEDKTILALQPLEVNRTRK